MEALSRREEEEVMESAKTQALKACDEFVKSKFTIRCAKLTGSLRRLCNRPYILTTVRMSTTSTGNAGMYEGLVSCHDRFGTRADDQYNGRKGR
jgi:hypothetical protein